MHSWIKPGKNQACGSWDKQLDHSLFTFGLYFLACNCCKSSVLLLSSSVSQRNFSGNWGFWAVFSKAIVEGISPSLTAAAFTFEWIAQHCSHCLPILCAFFFPFWLDYSSLRNASGVLQATLQNMVFCVTEGLVFKAPDRKTAFVALTFEFLKAWFLWAFCLVFGQVSVKIAISSASSRTS